MKTNSHSENLALNIALLESRQQNEWLDIKDHITIIKENLRPLNVLKTVINEVKDTIGSNNNLLKIALGFGIDYIVHKIVVKKTENKFRNFVGALFSSAAIKFADRLKKID